MKKRIFAFLLAFVVLIGGIGVRPQRAYASAVLAGEAVDVLYGLLGTMGVVVGFQKTHAQKQEEVIQFFEGLGTAEKSAFWEWYQSGTWATADTGHRVFNPSMELDTSWYRSFWQSAVDYCSTFVSYAPPISGAVSYSLPSDGSGDFWDNPLSLGSCSDIPFVVFSRSGMSDVFVLLPSGHYLYYVVNHETMAISGVKYGLCPSDTNFVLRLQYYKASGVGFVVYTQAFAEPSIDGFNTTGSVPVSGGASFGGVAWGDSSSAHYVGNVFSGAMTFSDSLAVSHELVPCDSWVKQWDDAKAEKRQVGIIAGKDLTGYDTVSDVYAPDTGLVTGLETPTVDVPVTGDLTGIAKGLSDILSKLKALPTAISTAVIGKGTLNFDKFKDIKFSGVFPFCIPFDLINSFKVFNVPPVEPVWVVEFSKTPMVGMPDFVIDMTEYDWLFSIGRFFAYISFVIGLILITRNIIKG